MIRARRKVRNNVIQSCLKLLLKLYSDCHTILLKYVYPLVDHSVILIKDQTHYLYPNYTLSVPCIYMPLLKGMIGCYKNIPLDTTGSPIYDYNIYSHRITSSNSMFEELYCVANSNTNNQEPLYFHLYELCLLGFLDSIHNQNLEEFHFVMPLQQLFENVRLIRYSPFANRREIASDIIREYQRVKEIIKGRITKKESCCSGYFSKLSNWLYI